MAIHFFFQKLLLVKHERGKSCFPCPCSFVLGFVQTCKCSQTKVDAQASFDCTGWKCHPAVLIFFQQSSLDLKTFHKFIAPFLICMININFAIV